MKKVSHAISRRALLKQSAVGAAMLGFSRWTARSYGQIVGSNDDLRVAVVGCNDCGRSHIKQVRALPGVRLVSLCDVDSAVIDRDLAVIAASPAAASGQSEITRYTDVRKLLENRDIDAITVASPNHWHALMTVWGVQAGKDVYIEKPTCHNIWEGRQAVAASRKYNRIVQAGTQWRSMPHVYEAFQWVKAGNLGKVQVSRGFCYKRRPSLGKTQGPQPVPTTVDYDLWCGPAPMDPLRRKNLHYDWHWVWPTGNGDIGNQGAHNMDLARWVLDKPAVAPSAITIGGRLGYEDDGQTPNTVMAVHDYGDALLIFEVRGLPVMTATEKMDQYKGISVGNVVQCQNGYVTVTDHGAAAFDPRDKQIRQFTGAGVQRDQNHMENFVKAVRSRRREDQNGELVEGQISSSLSHISNISYRLGQKSDPEAIKAAIKSNPAALETFSRLQIHLANNNIKMDTSKATLGVPLQIDPDSQKFVGNEGANALLTREYRAPFVVPEKI